MSLEASARSSNGGPLPKRMAPRSVGIGGRHCEMRKPWKSGTPQDARQGSCSHPVDICKYPLRHSFDGGAAAGRHSTGLDSHPLQGHVPSGFPSSFRVFGLRQFGPRRPTIMARYDTTHGLVFLSSFRLPPIPMCSTPAAPLLRTFRISLSGGGEVAAFAPRTHRG